MKKKKDLQSLFKCLVMFHINVFIKMFCSCGNIPFKKTPDGWCCQQTLLVSLSIGRARQKGLHSTSPFLLLRGVAYPRSQHSETMKPGLMSRFKNRMQSFPIISYPAKTKCSTSAGNNLQALHLLYFCLKGKQFGALLSKH